MTVTVNLLTCYALLYNMIHTAYGSNLPIGETWAENTNISILSPVGQVSENWRAFVGRKWRRQASQCDAPPLPPYECSLIRAELVMGYYTIRDFQLGSSALKIWIVDRRL